MNEEDIYFYREQEKMIVQNLSDKVGNLVDTGDDGALDEVKMQLEEFYENIKHQYILSFDGNVSKVTADAQNMLDRISKKKFQAYLQSLKRSIPDENILRQLFQKLPEPQQSKKINDIPLIIRQMNKQTSGNFKNCLHYLLNALRLYTDTLQYYGLPTAELEKLAEKKAAEWYKKPRNIREINISHIERSSEQAQKAFYDMPDSPASHFLIDILSAGSCIAEVPSRKKQVSHSTKYSVMQKGDKRLVSMENQNGSLTVEIEDISRLVKTGMRFFILSMIKANEQILHDGKISREYITFSLEELIENGMYSSTRSARRGFLAARDALTSLKVRGQIEKGGKKNTIDDLSVLFIRGGIENNQCYLYMNPYVDWNFLAQYFTKIPKYFFCLSDNAARLLYYIFYLARQNTRNIAERGCFTIKFRSIHSLLMLPGEKGNPKPQETIKIPIEKAICEIETEHSKIYRNQEFSMLTVYDEKMKISEYLDEGYLKISMKGAFAADFIAWNSQKEQKTIQTEKRKARIAEKALAINTAKNIENSK